MMTMTRDDKKAWLDRYREALCRATLIEDELREARAAALPGSPGLDGMPRGNGGGSVVEQAVLDIALIADELRTALDEVARVRGEILKAIETLPALEYGIMRKRHLDPACPWRVVPWIDVAETVYLSESRARHLYGDALDKLAIPGHNDRG